MPIAMLVIGALLIIVAFNNTMGQLATELENDIPGFFVWAIAITAILGLGYIPGLRTPSRWILGLVVLVILLVNYKAILSGFTGFAGTGAALTAKGDGTADPATAFASSPKAPEPTAAQVAGDAGASAGATGVVGNAGGAGGDPMSMITGLLTGGLPGGSMDFGGQMLGLGGGGGGGMGGFDPSTLMSGFGGGMGGGGGFGGMDMSSMSSLAMLALL